MHHVVTAARSERVASGLLGGAAAAAALGLVGCGVDVSSPARLPHVEVWDVAEFTDLQQDYGRALARADADGDGIDELLVGAPASDPAGDGVVLIVSAASLAVVDVLLPWRDRGESSAHHDEFGVALAVGDWNGDGIVDVAVGDPGADLPGVERAGEAWVFAGPIGTSPPIRLRASTPRSGERFGATLGSGDFDGDGVDDLAVAAPHASDPSSDPDPAGLAVFFGPTLARSERWEAPGGGGRFGAVLVAIPTGDAGATGATLVAGAPDAEGPTGRSGDAFAWERALGAAPPRRIAVGMPVDGGFGCAGDRGDFDGDGRGDLALLAPRGAGGLYFFDPASYAERRRIALPTALGPRRGAPAIRLDDVTGDGADELVLLSAGGDEPAGVLLSPARAPRGRTPPYLRLDSAAAAALVSNFDFDDEPELLLAVPPSFRPEGGRGRLRVLDFSWREAGQARRARAPAAIPGIAELLAR